MYVGFLRFGGNTIINNELTRGYSRTWQCPLFWHQNPWCDGMNDALDEDWAYDEYPAEETPWYDPKLASESSRFMGVWGIDFSMVQDSTRTVPTAEGILDGGVIGRTRKAMKRFRVRALLVGYGRDALDYGMAWLNAALDPDACGHVSRICGTADLEWFTDCPPSRASYNPPITDAEYKEDVDNLRRYLRTSAAETGAIVTSESRRNDFFGYEVEFDFVSETAYILGISHTIPLDPASPSVIQDIVYNLVPVPSAELAGSSTVVAQNFSTNPSSETNITGWQTSVFSPFAATLVTSRSNEVAANGSWSYKVVATTTNTSAAAGALQIVQDVTLPAYYAGQRFSVSMWAFTAVSSGTAVLTNNELRLQWLDAANAVLSTVTVGQGASGGAPIAGSGYLRPATAVTARMLMRGQLASWSTGAVLNMFADAIVVSNP